jgi:plastocyanin
MRLRSLRRSVLAGAALLVLTAACGTEPPAASSEVPDGVGPSTSSPVVEVDDNVFRPEQLVVEVGTEVRWEWHGRAAHDVSGDGFESEIEIAGEFRHTFAEVGTYPYVCTLHPGMEGTVYVVPAG